MFNWLYGPVLLTKADRLSTYAAALSYNVVLSMVPFLAVTYVLGMHISVHLDVSKQYEQDFARVFNELIPTGSQVVSEQSFKAVENSSLGGFVPIGLIFAVYTSFSLMEQIIRTLMFIFDDPKRPQVWSWMVVVKTIVLLVIWMILLLLISISAVEASILRTVLKEFIFSTFTRDLVKVAQVLVVIFALYGTFFLTYYMISARRFRTGLIVEGSLLAACGWVACSLLFAMFLPRILQTSAAYIALGSVVAIMLWAQACAWSLIIGACWIVRFSPTKK
jgi:YihY family inner membrane protein